MVSLLVLPFPRQLLLLLALLVSSCSLLAPYDEVSDRAVYELASNTEAALAKADAGQLSTAESQQFLLERIGQVRALKTRASLKAQNSEEENVLGQLEERYQALASRGKPLRSSLATGLRATLLDLQQIQVAKKRSASSTGGSKPQG
ncbi:MAG: hypothetical protein ABI883_05500 [Chthoniobacterales bacterium]